MRGRAIETQTRYKIWPFAAYRDGALLHIQYGACDAAWSDFTTGGPPEPH
jgi:hypothetical protein